MTGELRKVCQDNVISDLAIMTDVSVRHDEYTVPHSGDPTAFLAAEVHRSAFADPVVVPDDELGLPVFVAPILRWPAQRRTSLDEIVGAHHNFPMRTAKSRV